MFYLYVITLQIRAMVFREMRLKSYCSAVSNLNEIEIVAAICINIEPDSLGDFRQRGIDF